MNKHSRPTEPGPIGRTTRYSKRMRFSQINRKEVYTTMVLSDLKTRFVVLGTAGVSRAQANSILHDALNRASASTKKFQISALTDCPLFLKFSFLLREHTPFVAASISMTPLF